MSHTVAAFYRFVPVPDPGAVAARLRAAAAGTGLRGTVLVAPEGLNGTVAGRPAAVEAILGAIRALPGCAEIEVKRSAADGMPFRKLRIRLKREIVTLGRPEADPGRAVGTYVEPAAWNALITAPDVAVIDTRNAYETAIGSFAGAIDPGTDSFGAFPDWWAANAARFGGKRIAMFCTGGIRCEKASSYLLSQGVAEVFHLSGGILRYLEEVPAEDSLWQGACFVFDGRVSVGHGLAEGPHLLCHACRQPIRPEDRARPEYERGVSCHLCHGARSAADRARFRERQRQIDLAAARGGTHLAGLD